MTRRATEGYRGSRTLQNLGKLLRCARGKSKNSRRETLHDAIETRRPPNGQRLYIVDWKMIQDHPELFDGVSVGAPAIDFLGLLGWFGYFFTTLGTNSSDTWLTDNDWAMVHQSVLDECDGLDGAVDGIIDEIRRCHPDPSQWSCDGSNVNSTWCLSSAQVEAVRKIFSPFVINGTLLHSGAAHGDEARLIQSDYGGLPLSWVNEWMSFIVKEDLSWNWTQWTDADGLAAFQQDKGNVQTYDADISAFRDRGGKVLHWHGQGMSASQMISLFLSILTMP
jgi:feruloyl esterase